MPTRVPGQSGAVGLALAVGCLMLVGCAWGGVSRPPVGQVGQVALATSSRPPAFIAAEELMGLSGQSVLAAVRRLRPRLLDPGRPTIMAPRGERPVVYLDGVPLGALETLETLSAGEVREIRRLSETEAFARFPRRHPGGVLLVIRR